jgi:hypothetical protein
MEQTDREQSISINEADIGEAADLLGVQKRAFLLEAESRCGDAPRVELFVGSKSYKNIHIYEKMGYRTYRSEDIRDDVKLLYMEKRRPA